MDLIIAGVDEAGRGPLAGPVIAAAVILQAKPRINGIRDSKQLTALEREKLYEKITSRSVAWAVGRAEVEEIDRINILQATFLAMQRAVAALKVSPQLILVDGNMAPPFDCPTQTIIDGDAKEITIGASSIIAKVTRDREMIELDKLYPHYGFSKHKGYSTEEHLSALKKYGPCKIHRNSFAPVREALNLELIS